ncbi:MAG: GTPase domain-containing protein [Anaerolineae bacterium]|nr:GTPase domain-containing protein [Anaerolineae bacterium]
MFINWKHREINLKIVYYGPALSGKTTNLQYIHAKTNPNIRGDLVSLKTRGDRTIYFDFLQLELGQIAGLKPRFNLYTVPGQVYYVGSRKLVLQGADGVVFVADSQWNRMQANTEMIRNMEHDLREMGHNPHTIPLVLQCNKRDLPDAAPVPLMRQQFGRNGAPCFESIATQGNGVFDTLKAIINLVVNQAQQRI